MPQSASPNANELPPELRFLAGGGAATRLILARDWRDHPLGVPARWPTELKTAISLILNSPESMILAWDRDELFFFFNETYFPLLGPRLDWAMGTKFDQVWADGWEQAKPIIDDAFVGRSQRFVDLPWKLDTDRGAADTWWTFSYSRVLDAAGDVAGLFIFTNETTARVLTDRALAESQAQLQALNEGLEREIELRTAERDRMWRTSPDLMVVVSAGGRYIRTNPAWHAILGYDASELFGLDATALAHPDGRAEAERALATARTGVLPTFENRFRHKDGSYRWIQWVAAPGETEIFAIGRDVTAEKEAAAQLHHATEQLHQAQKMDAIGQLTGGVAHDFNNLLTIIRGSVELLRRPNIAPDKRDRYIDAIGDTADRAAKLTGQLLAFARRQALTPELVDVGATIGDIGDMVRTLTGSRIALDLDLPATPCFAQVDRSQLETAIVNLAINARDAMDGDGTLTIAVAAASGIPDIRGHHAVDGDFVLVSVTDRGIGIGEDDLPHIFEPFFTTKGVGKGTGLGLSQVIGFAKQSGGDVTVDSVAGQGTTFGLYLPRAVGDDAPQNALPPVETAAGAGACILLVEDNAEVGRFATEALRELGYESVLAPNAAEALRLIERDSQRFDIVFSDVVMPGTNGVELGTTIRARWPDLPVLLTSGYSHVLAENAQHGFELLHKPYSVEQLAHALGRLIAGPPLARDRPL